MEDQDYILFDQYLTGELSAKDSNAFEERLNSDSEYANQFNIYKDVHSHLQNTIENEAESSMFEENLKGISENYFNQAEGKTEKQSITETEQKTKTYTFFKYAMAACVALLIGITAFNEFTGVPKYGDYNSHEPMTVVRGEAKDLTEATKAFNSENYEKAELLFNKILNDDPSNLEIELYKSIALIELGSFAEADELLWKLSETDSTYKDKAKWYWALSKLKQKEFDECIKMLKTIPLDADDYKQAQKLLNKLE